MDDLSWFEGCRVLVTGHTGFKGAWLSMCLRRLGAEVVGLSLEPAQPSLFAGLNLGEEVRSHFGDIQNRALVERVMNEEQPDVVFHLAAQPLVRRSQREPVETFATNVQGTVHVLEAIRHTPSVRAVVCVTSDKCYENRGWDWGYRENDPLGGDDPYSASKACAELVVKAYQRSYFDRADAPLGIASVRAGNVLGGGDWAEDRIIPDTVRALAKGNPVRVRRPGAVRPWQHVLEAIAGYVCLVPKLASQPFSYAGPWNFGPQADNATTVRELLDLAVGIWGGGLVRNAVDSENEPIEASYLRLCIDKSVSRLPWRPLWNLETTLRHTMTWYRAHQEGASPAALRALCEEQITAYETAWRPRVAVTSPPTATLPLRRISA